MRSGWLFSFATAVIAVMVGPAPARAGVGLEVVLRPGYGSAGDKSPVLYEPTGFMRMQPSEVGSVWAGTAKPYGGGFVLDGAIGYRPLPFVSFGLTGGWRKSAVSSSGIQDVSGISRSALQVGFYGRGYLPLLGMLTNLDPWASVGATYVYDKQTYDQPIPVTGLGTISMPISLTHHGVGIPLGLGIDYRVLPFLAVGPSFQYEIVVPVVGCMTMSPNQAGLIDFSQCSDADTSQRVTAAKNYGVWSVGLSLRLAL
jgi:hypothetical protein